MARDLRYVEGGEVEPLVDPGRNAVVLGYLARHQPSCHSDTGTALFDAAAGHASAIAFSPSFGQCRYVAVIAHRTIVALGLGMRSACLRLPNGTQAAALAAGAALAPELGEAWVRFELFDPDRRPALDLAGFTSAAIEAATPSRS